MSGHRRGHPVSPTNAGMPDRGGMGLGPLVCPHSHGDLREGSIHMTSDEISGIGLANVGNLPPDVLVLTVTNINRGTRKARQAQATAESTKLYLQAGVRLICKEFSPEARENEDGEETVPPFFAWLSRTKVVAEAKKEAEETGSSQVPTTDQMRDKWDPHRHYLADLLRVAVAIEYGYSAAYQDPDQSIDLGPDNITEFIHETAYRDMRGVLQSPTFRISLLAAVVSQREPELQAAIQDAYQVTSAGWSRFYEDAMRACGLRLRSGITINEFTMILTAVAEGLAIRGLADTTANVIDHKRRRSLLGTAAMAMTLACCERDDDAASLTIEEFLAKSWS
jgi:hypothetical protein